MKEELCVTPLPGYEPEIGRWLWALQEVRRGTLGTVAGLSQAVLDWEGPRGDENSIGSLLYHIALVELSWLFLDIREEDLPDAIQAEFPHAMGDAEGRLTRVPGVPLEDHLRRLERSRDIFLDAMRGMTLDDWRRLRSPGDVDYRVTPEWAVFHLVEHEAGHLFEMRSLKRRASRTLSPGRSGGNSDQR